MVAYLYRPNRVGVMYVAVISHDSSYHQGLGLETIGPPCHRYQVGETELFSSTLSEVSLPSSLLQLHFSPPYYIPLPDSSFKLLSDFKKATCLAW